MGRPPLSIDIASKDQKELAKLLSGGVQQVRVVLRALALLQLAKGASAPQIANLVAVRSANRKTSSRVDRDTRRHSGMATGTSHSQRRRRFTSPGRREASAARPVRAAAASVDTTPDRK